MGNQELDIFADVELFSKIVRVFTDKALSVPRESFPDKSDREWLRDVIGTVLADFSMLQDGTFSLSDFLGGEASDEATY